MKKLFAISALLLSTTAAHGKSAKIEASDLVGTWKLVKSENPTADGTTVPYCNGVHGYIIYTDDGHVSVGLNCGERSRPSEPADSSGRKFFYVGTYAIDESEVIHSIENASDTQLMGTSQRRTIDLSGNILVLLGFNQGQNFSATWQKVSPDDLP